MHQPSLLLVLAFLFGSVTHVHAAILSTDGAVMIIPAPADLRLGALESDTEIRLIQELQNLSLPSDLLVDVTVAGTSPEGGLANISPGSIAGGTRVNSYLVHFDTIAAQSVGGSGSITFAHDILGVMLRSDTLINADAIVGIPGLLYPDLQGRGIEPILVPPVTVDALDSFTLSPDLRTASFNFLNLAHIDQIRIITAVPEPTSALLLVVAAATVCVARRRLLAGAGGRT